MRQVSHPRLVLLLLAASLSLPVSPAPAQQHFPASDDAELMLRYLVEDGETPGIVVGFLGADGSTRIVAYGDAGPGAAPLNGRSLFEIGSITKTFTAALLADMAERGEVALHDPVQKYLPEGVRMPSWDGQQITLQHLSTHHSGLPRMPDNFAPADPDNPYSDYGADRLYAFLTSHQLRRAPGAEYEYSNLGVGLLGHLLARVSGQSYEDLVHERILEPLEMSSTAITLTGELAGRLVSGHNGIGEVVPHWDVTTLAGAGGLRSSAEDMLKYLAAQTGPPSSQIERAMRLTHEPRVEREDGEAQALGWSIRRVGARRLLAHDGGTAGFRTFAGFDPDLGVGIVVLTNTGDFGDDIGADLLRRGAPISDATVQVPREVLAERVGVYGPRAEQALVVRQEEEGWLTVQAPGNVRFRLYATSDSTFYVRRTPWRFTFHRDADGAIGSVTAHLADADRTARRLEVDPPDSRAHAGNPPLRDDLPPLSAEEMTPYEGDYDVRMGGQTLSVRVYVEEGRLMAQPAGQRSTRLIRQGSHTFVVAADTDDRVVFEVENGRADRLTLHDDGRTLSGVRRGSGATLAAEPVRDLPLSREEIARYAGTYLLAIGPRMLELRVFGRDGRLISQAAGQQEAPLRYQGEHVFVPNFDDSVRLVFEVAEGVASSVTLHQGGGAFPGARQPE